MPPHRPADYVEHRFKLSRWNRRKTLRIWLNPQHGLATFLVPVNPRVGMTSSELDLIEAWLSSL